MTKTTTDICPYAQPGLRDLWQRGRRDGFRGTPFPPAKHCKPTAKTAYKRGYAVGTAEFGNRPV